MCLACKARCSEVEPRHVAPSVSPCVSPKHDPCVSTASMGACARSAGQDLPNAASAPKLFAAAARLAAPQATASNQSHNAHIQSLVHMGNGLAVYILPLTLRASASRAPSYSASGSSRSFLRQRRCRSRSAALSRSRRSSRAGAPARSAHSAQRADATAAGRARLSEPPSATRNAADLPRHPSHARNAAAKAGGPC
jgi:hypothetical protein